MAPSRFQRWCKYRSGCWRGSEADWSDHNDLAIQALAGSGTVSDLAARWGEPQVHLPADAQGPSGHRQLGCRPACEMGLSQVGGPDDNVRCSQLHRLSLPG